MLFKHDPLFGYFINELPKGHFLKIVELRKQRKQNPQNAGTELAQLLGDEGAME